MRELEAENARLKRMYADLALENSAIKDVLPKNSDAVSETAGGASSGDGAPTVDTKGLRGSRPVAGSVLQDASSPTGYRAVQQDLSHRNSGRPPVQFD
jgi:hypothetical protein